MEDYKVKNISEAEFGRKEISLAATEMPGLMALRKEYKGKNPLCIKCSSGILIERVCTTCNIKYKTKFKGVNPYCNLCKKKNKMKKIDKGINKDIQKYETLRYSRASEGFPQGFKQNRYVVCHWKRSG